LLSGCTEHKNNNDYKNILGAGGSTEQKFKLIPLDENHKDYKYVSEKMQKSIKSHVGFSFSKYNIIKVKY
jgi:uncharacterized radical SAM superfamily protein